MNEYNYEYIRIFLIETTILGRKIHHTNTSMSKLLSTQQLAWPLYGSGVDELGKNGRPIIQDIPGYGKNEMLMRIDAISLCYTDVKEIDQGQNHPRLLGRDLSTEPIIPGHEVCMTVAGLGVNLHKNYHVGDRFTLQPDVWVDGKSIPFCFGMDGGYRQYAVIGKEILEGDAGNYLIPIPVEMSYAAAAITEPWACVEAAYRGVYRDSLKEKGITWIAGSKETRNGYQFERLLELSKPAKIIVSQIPDVLFRKLEKLTVDFNIKLEKRNRDDVIAAAENYDDIVILDCSSGFISRAAKKLANFGALAILDGDLEKDPIEIDLGRLHYDNIYFVGSTELEVFNAYQMTKPRTEFKRGGKAWILGAGGPMGRMHLQRMIEAKEGPGLILASEVTEDRFASLFSFFNPMAEKHQKELRILNPKTEAEKFAEFMQKVMDKGGFDDIEVMVAIEAVIADSVKYLAKEGVINLFAGLRRGVFAKINPGLIFGPKQVRLVGHSGSALDDQKAVVHRAISGDLKPELSVAAIGGMNQIADGIRAMKNWVYPGKIVIFPHVIDYPLTGLDDLRDRDPEIHKALGDNLTWTRVAESIFLEKYSA